MKNKIAIIGAGPVGCYIAQLLKSSDCESILIEEHNEIGRPIHCTGLVGKKVFEGKNSLKISPSAIINTINGAVIHYNNQHFILQRERVAYVVDREKFDKELSRNLKILFQNKFLGLERVDSGYVIETDKDEIFANIIIGADGANSVVRKILNQNSDFRSYRGVQFRLETKVRYKDLVEVYLKKPSFFWIVPESENIVRIGTISDSPFKDLENFMKEEKIKGEVLEKFGGAVTLGICNSTVRDNIAIVGDAACQIKPLTYGGVYFGLKAASILADCIKENRLKDYDSLWKKELLSEIKIGLTAKNIYTRLDEKEVKKIFDLLKYHKSLIEKVGDFESHSQIILEILKKPAIYPQIASLSQLLFKKIII